MKTPTCPKCGEAARHTDTKYGPRYECCGLWSWDRAPLVDAETHRARQAAHEAFDPIWKSGRMNRTQAYKLLAQNMGLPPKDCHIKKFNVEQAQSVLKIVSAIWKEGAK